MAVKSRDLGAVIYYVFNGRDFIVNKNLPAAEYINTIARCEKEIPDSGKAVNTQKKAADEREREGK